MRKILMAVAAAIGLAVVVNGQAMAQIVPSQDHFESRRRDAEYRENLRRQQELANRRTVPTWTIPQPNYRNHPGHHHGRRHHRHDGDYVFVPGHYQYVYGQLVYVPPRYQYVPRY